MAVASVAEGLVAEGRPEGEGGGVVVEDGQADGRAVGEYPITKKL